MSKELLGGLIRHLVTFLSTLLATEGVSLGERDLDQIAGFLGLAITVVWQIIEKRRQVKKERQLKMVARLAVGAAVSAREETAAVREEACE